MESSTVALREFLLAIENVKQPLDRPIQSFLQATRDEPKLLNAFLNVHAQCEPLFHVWPDESGKNTRWEDRDSIAAFIELMIHFLTIQTTSNASIAEVIALKIVREKSTSLEKLMTWSDKPLIEFRVLNLMTAIVCVSMTTAREFVRLFDFQSAAFTKMSSRRLKKSVIRDKEAEQNADAKMPVELPDTPSFQIREAYVHFVFALTSCSEKSVHRFALKDGGVTSSLFKSMDGDDEAMFSMIISHLVTFVLDNENVDERGKASIFNIASIQQLVTIVRGQDTVVAGLALSLLRRLFLSDQALYFIPVEYSLLAFVTRLKADDAAVLAQETTNEQAVNSVAKMIRTVVTAIGLNDFIRSDASRMLVTELISRYPGLLSEYFMVLAPHLEPKVGFRWFCIASMVQKLLACPLDNAIMGTECFQQSSAHILGSKVIFPLACRKELSRCIQHSNHLLIYTSLGIISTVLDRFQFMRPHLTPTMQTDLQNEMRVLLPSPEAIVALMMKLNTTSSTDNCALLYIRAIAVLRLYIECLPQAMSEIKVDFTKVLAWNYFDRKAFTQGGVGGNALSGVIAGELLRFLIAIDDARLVFLLSSSPSVNGTQKSLPQSKLLRLLLLYVSPSISNTARELARRVLHRVLRAFKVFGTRSVEDSKCGLVPEEEIVVWLDQLVTAGDAAAHFVELVIQELVADPFFVVDIYQTHASTPNYRSCNQSISPATVALVAALNGWGSERWCRLLDGVCHDQSVVAFCTRLLMSVWTRSNAQLPFARLITASSNVNEVEHPPTRKRKRVEVNDNCDSPYETFRSFLRAYLGLPTSSENKFTTKTMDYLSTLAENAISHGKCVQFIHHQISARMNLEIEQFLTARSVQKDVSSLLQDIINGLPMPLFMQRLMYVIAHRASQEDGSTMEFLQILNAKMASNTLQLDTKDIATMCEQALVCCHVLQHSSIDHGDLISLLGEFLVRLLVHLHLDGCDHMKVRWKRIIHKMSAFTSVHTLVLNPILVVKLIAHSLSASIGEETEIDSVAIAGSLKVAMLASSLPSSLRALVLNKLLCMGTDITPTTLYGPLVQNVLYTLNDDVDIFISDKDTLRKRLWVMLTHKRVLTFDRSLSFYSAGLHVLGQLGGVSTFEVQETLESTWVLVLIHAAISLSTSVNGKGAIEEFVRRLKAAIRIEERVISSDVETLMSTLLSRVLFTLQDANNPDAHVLALSSFLSTAPSTIIYSHAEAHLIETVQSIFENKMIQSGQYELVTALRLGVVRHVLLGEGFSRLRQALSSLRVSTTKMSASHLICILLLLRAGCTEVQDLEDSPMSMINIPKLVSFVVVGTESLVRNGVNYELDPDFLLEAASVAVAGLRLHLDQSIASDVLIDHYASLCSHNNIHDVYNRLVRAMLVSIQCLNEENRTVADRYLCVLIKDEELFASALVNSDINVVLLRVIAVLYRLLCNGVDATVKSKAYSHTIFQYLLSAYNMTLSRADRIIFGLLHDIGLHAGISPAQYGYRFGASFTAVSIQDAETQRHDLVDDSTWLVTGGLDQATIRRTIEYFPLDRGITSTTIDDRTLVEDFGSFVSEDNDVEIQNALIYDPSYLLPMMAHAVASSSLSDAAIVQQGLLGIAIRATSSNADEMREYAYGVLAHVHESLSSDSSSEFRPGRQVHLLLETLKNAITEPLEGVSSVITVFMNDALSILTRPAHVMYPHVNRFLLARPAIDLSDIPMFYTLFNSSSPLTYKQERSWLLHNLRRGVREDADVALLIRRHVPSILLSFYNSELADEHTQLLVGNIFKLMCRTNAGSLYLVTKCAFIEWLCGNYEHYNRSTPISIVILMAELFEETLKATVWDDLDPEQYRTLKGAAVSCYGACHAALIRCGLVDNEISSRLSVSIMQIVNLSCPLSTLMTVFATVKPTLSLKCADLLLAKDDLFLHLDFHRCRFDEWATLMVDMIKAASFASQSSHVGTLMQGKRVLSRLNHIMTRVPTIKKLVLTHLNHDLVSLSCLD